MIRSFFILALMVGSWAAPGRAAVRDAFEEQWVNELALRLQPGLRRAEVEKILFHHLVGAQPANATLYLQSDWIVEVPYDQTGGQNQADNRINGPIKIEPAN